MTPRIAIAAVMRQEGPYVLEWVAWHRLLGFEIFIADNGGTDGQSWLLSQLHARGEITRIDVSMIREKPQIPAYHVMLRLARDAGVDYLGFIDADEFFETIEPNRAVADAPSPISAAWAGSGARTIATSFAKSRRPVVAFNWMCFGDGGQTEPGSEPVVERFVRAANKDWESNLHFKSFCDVAAVSKLLERERGARITPHGPMLDAAFYWHDDRPITFGGSFGFSDHVSWNVARIRHYVIKTFPEYIAGKMARGYGDASRAKSRYDRAHYDQYNRNEMDADLPPEILGQLRDCMSRLGAGLDGEAERGQPMPGMALPPWKLAWMAREFGGNGRVTQFDKSLRFFVKTAASAVVS